MPGEKPGVMTRGSNMGYESFLGSIGWFAGSYAPKGWLFCDGHQLSIQQNTALFSILGTIYGGNGTSNFALPDLRPKNPDGSHRDWTDEPRACICVEGVYPSRW